jgi:tRNA nucleotidyltransferase (CCA-adding enzyme)
VIQLIGEIADMYFQEVRSPMPKLVTGSDLMKEFALPASPTIGKLLQQVRKAQIDGLIETRAEAIEMVREILLRD